MIKNEFRFLLFILAFSIILRLIFFDTSYFIWDETVYMMHGKLISGESAGYNEIDVRPPVLQVILSMIWKFSSVNNSNYEIFSRFVITILNTFIVIPVYYLGKIISEKTARISSVIIALLPVSILHSRYVLTDHLGALLGLSAFVLFYYGTFINKKKIPFFLAGFFLSLAILTKFTNLLLLIIIAPLLGFLVYKKRFSDILSSVSSVLISMMPFFIYNFLKYKNPFFIFERAWTVVAEPIIVETDFILYMFTDSLGIIFILCSVLGTAYFIRDYILKNSVENKNRFSGLFFLFSFSVILIYFLKIIYQGVAKPPSIEWETERFMLLLVPFVVVLCSYFFEKLETFWEMKVGKRWFFDGKLLVFGLILAGLIIQYPQFVRAYMPQIDFENGLRHVTKVMGFFLRDLKDSSIGEIVCIGNCPSIVYYSGKKIQVVYSKDEFLDSPARYKVSFYEIPLEDSNLLKKFCRDKWCSYVYISKIF